jgi:hypothetical protein
MGLLTNHFTLTKFEVGLPIQLQLEQSLLQGIVSLTDYILISCDGCVAIVGNALAFFHYHSQTKLNRRISLVGRFTKERGSDVVVLLHEDAIQLDGC